VPTNTGGINQPFKDMKNSSTMEKSYHLTHQIPYIRLSRQHQMRDCPPRLNQPLMHGQSILGPCTAHACFGIASLLNVSE
jgi:hypothetical protein